MFHKKVNDSSLSEELSYWDFSNEPRAHIILNDGSLVSGMKLSLLDIECFDDNSVNQLAIRLRGVLNSISENTSVQFCLSVGSDYSEVLHKHKSQKSENIHPLIDRIARYREEKLDAAIDSSELYKPELTVYLRTKSILSKKINFLKKEEAFSGEAVKNYDETLEVLFQNIDTLISSLASIGLTGRLLEVQEMQNQIYKMLNPKRSAFEPSPLIKTPSEDSG